MASTLGILGGYEVIDDMPYTQSTESFQVSLNSCSPPESEPAMVSAFSSFPPLLKMIPA